MLSKLLLFIGHKIVGNSTLTSVLLALLAAHLIAMLIWVMRLESRIADTQYQHELETAAHNATKAELMLARRDLATLRVALEQSRQGQGALRMQVVAAHESAAEAVNAAQTRKRILDAVKPTVRPVRPGEVVDDATRHAVADRLNRPL